MEEKEVWKYIDGYPTYYVSNKGRVKRVKKEKEHILKPAINNCGYLIITLYCNGKQKTYGVHQLVAKAFIENPTALPEVNHKDEIKTHNFVENLEWCDARYNNNFGTKKERMSAIHINHPAFSKPVRQLTLDGEVLATYPSIHEAVRISGLYFNTIWRSANGITKNPRKFNWEYVS